MGTSARFKIQTLNLDKLDCRGRPATTRTTDNVRIYRHHQKNAWNTANEGDQGGIELAEPDCPSLRPLQEQEDTM